MALARALAALRARGGIGVVVSHRNGLLEQANKVAVVIAGELRDFGLRNEVMARLAGPAAPGRAQPVPAVAGPGGPLQAGMRVSGRIQGMARRDPPAGGSGGNGGKS